jgi:hypothetical protein
MGNDYLPSGADGVAVKWGNISPLDTTQTYIQTDTSLSPTAITKKDLQAIVIHTGTAFSQNHVEMVSDGDALNPALQQNIDMLMGKFLQSSLISCTKGAFAAASASDYKTTLAGETGTAQKLSWDSIMTIKNAHFPNIRITNGHLIVHSDVYSDLVKANAILFTADVQNNIYGTALTPSIGGFNVIVNNDLCVKSGSTNATYTSYMTKENPFWINNSREPRILTSDNILLGGGTTQVAIYMDYACAPAYASWAGAVNAAPTDTTLEIGTNWEFKAPSDLHANIIQIISRVDPTTSG